MMLWPPGGGISFHRLFETKGDFVCVSTVSIVRETLRASVGRHGPCASPTLSLHEWSCQTSLWVGS